MVVSRASRARRSAETERTSRAYNIVVSESRTNKTTLADVSP
jgi:hypothetical protein